MIQRPREKHMGLYHWSMRHASAILFGVALALFLIGLGQAALAFKNTAVAAVAIGGEQLGSGLTAFLLLLSGTFTALSSAAIPFVGAVAVHRWDRRSRD